MKELVFEKSISRDWGVIYSEVWHRVFTVEFKKQFNWSYTEVVFEVQNNTTSVYRAPLEHIDGMRQFILKKIDKNPRWMQEECRVVERQVDYANKLVAAIERHPLESYQRAELAQLFSKLIEQNVKLGPLFVIMLWFPIQMENRPEAIKYKKYIDQAIETRRKIERIGPIIDSFSQRIASLCAKQLKISIELSRYIKYDEVINYLESDEEIDQTELEKRKNPFLITSEGIVFETIREYLTRRGFKLAELNTSATTEVKGRAAFPGKVSGVVKIILNKEEFYKFNQDNILVTSMTTPDFAPVIKKCSAFVTDEGGITCHAAIIARELKKPCVIGTKIATKIFKDGDVVEVDASKGIVKKV